MNGLDLGFMQRRSVRLVRQTEVAECGLASLAMVVNFHGYDVDLGSLRRRFVPSARGVTLKSIISIADTLSMTCRALKLPLEELADLQMPAILHWNMNHFVVLDRFRGKKALIHDPATGSAWLSQAELSDHFTGVALELEPSSNFTSGYFRQSIRLRQLWSRMIGFKRSVAQVLLLSLVLQLFVLALPYYMQIAVDTALPALDNDLLAVLALGFALFTLVNAATSLLRGFVLLNAGTRLGYGLAINIARRLFRLPVDWFGKRSTGDVLSRFQSIIPIQEMLTEGAAAAVIDGVFTVLTLGLMLLYSPLLTLVVLVAFGAYALIRVISYAAERRVREASIILRGNEQTTLIETLRGITTLRLFNREALRLGLWQASLTSAVNADVQAERINIWQKTGNALVFGLENIVTIWIAIGFAIEGGFSVGMVFAFMAYKAQFVEKAVSLIDKAVAFRMLSLHLERLSDIAMTEEDVGFRAVPHMSPAPLKGHIVLKDICYRYSPSEPLVLDQINLEVRPGDNIAITGPSGGGKSTLVRILLGLVEPESGAMLVDGVPIRRYGYQYYRQQIAAVLQDDNLFAGSLADNIALFDDAPDRQRVMAAARAACIDADILAMPMGYETLIGDMGSSLSGGQKQRVLLARALYRQPRLLVVDEGTSHLDVANEQAVNQHIAAMNITRIIIAHRQETIRSSERVVIIKNGKIQTI